MDVVMGEPATNRGSAFRGIGEAVEAGADVVVLPELWTSGYVWLGGEDYEGPREAAAMAEDPGEGHTIPRFQEVVSREGIWLVAGSLLEADEGRVYNTSFVIDPRGDVVHRYRKVHLIGLMEEPRHLAAGDSAGIFEMHGWDAGVMICYDLRFPELARSLALQGAEVLFVPAQWPTPRIGHWEILVRARAVENQCFVVACNRVGVGGSDTFPGVSMIVGPAGEVLARGGEATCVLTAELDMDALKDIRDLLPVFSDRRPDLYHRDR